MSEQNSISAIEARLTAVGQKLSDLPKYQASTEIHKNSGDNSVSVQWVIDIKENGFHFTRKVNGIWDEMYAPVSREKAAVYAVAIVNGLQPPRDLRQCDKPVLEKAWPMTLEEFRAEVNKPQEGGPREVFRKMETERINLLLKIQEEQESSLKST